MQRVFLEYPKALFLHGECVIVSDLSQEARRRDAGWTDWAADNSRGNANDVVPTPQETTSAAAEPRRRGRPPKHKG